MYSSCKLLCSDVVAEKEEETIKLMRAAIHRTRTNFADMQFGY